MSVTQPNPATFPSLNASYGREGLLNRSILSPGDLFCIAVPLLQVVEFKMAGLLLGADLVLIAALPIALIRHRDRLRKKPIPLILTLGVLWLVSQILTDVIRGSAAEDYLRTWIKICFVLINFTVVWLVVCVSRRRFLFYGIALGLGTITSFFIHPSDDAAISPWKFGLGIPITMLVATLAALCARHRYWGVFLPLMAMAVVHMYKDFRIMAVICFIAAVYSLFLTSANRERFGRAHLALLAFTLAGGLAGFTMVYSHFAELGVFGAYAKQKLESQSGEGGLLLGGRSEILGSSQAIVDSPLIGHGSWARDARYSAIMTERRAELGYKKFQGGKRDDLIPTHSYLFGSWVEAGIFGGIFWSLILGFTAYAFLHATGREPLLPLFAFSSLMFMWDILFSPLGTPTRFVAPYFLATVVLFRLFQTVPPEFGWET